jgi:hypothetical protein
LGEKEACIAHRGCTRNTPGGCPRRWHPSPRRPDGYRPAHTTVEGVSPPVAHDVAREGRCDSQSLTRTFDPTSFAAPLPELPPTAVPAMPACPSHDARSVCRSPVELDSALFFLLCFPDGTGFLIFLEAPGFDRTAPLPFDAVRLPVFTATGG